MGEYVFPDIDFDVLRGIAAKWGKMHPCINKISILSKLKKRHDPYHISINFINIYISQDVDSYVHHYENEEEAYFDLRGEIWDKIVHNKFWSELDEYMILNGQKWWAHESDKWYVAVPNPEEANIPYQLQDFPRQEITFFERDESYLIADKKELTLDSEQPPVKEKTNLTNDIDDQIKNLTIRYENDTQITMQQKNKAKIPVALENLQFKGVGVTWNNFLKVLQDPPLHYWRCPEGADKKQIKVISDRLIEWISKNFNINFPDKYRLYEIDRTKEPGTYSFKFKIEYSDTTETDESSKETFRKRFFFNVKDYKKRPDPKKIKIIRDMATNGFLKGFLTNEEVTDAIKSKTEFGEEDMTTDNEKEDMTINVDEENRPMDLSEDDGGELNF